MLADHFGGGVSAGSCVESADGEVVSFGVEAGDSFGGMIEGAVELAEGFCRPAAGEIVANDPGGEEDDGEGRGDADEVWGSVGIAIQRGARGELCGQQNGREGWKANTHFLSLLR